MRITPLNPEDPPSTGDLELLGRGGMDRVFLGESLGALDLAHPTAARRELERLDAIARRCGVES